MTPLVAYGQLCYSRMALWILFITWVNLSVGAQINTPNLRGSLLLCSVVFALAHADIVYEDMDRKHTSSPIDTQKNKMQLLHREPLVTN